MYYPLHGEVCVCVCVRACVCLWRGDVGHGVSSLIPCLCQWKDIFAVPLSHAVAQSLAISEGVCGWHLHLPQISIKAMKRFSSQLNHLPPLDRMFLYIDEVTLTQIMGNLLKYKYSLCNKINTCKNFGDMFQLNLLRQVYNLWQTQCSSTHAKW